MKKAGSSLPSSPVGRSSRERLGPGSARRTSASASPRCPTRPRRSGTYTNVTAIRANTDRILALLEDHDGLEFSFVERTVCKPVRRLS